MMLLGTCVGFPLGVFVYGWRNYPWAMLPFVLASIILLHPVMEKDVPSDLGRMVEDTLLRQLGEGARP